MLNTGIVIVACDVLRDEIGNFAGTAPGVLATRFLEQGLHNDPPKLRTTLQTTIDEIENTLPAAQTIVLGYGLCSRGCEGLITTRCTLVLPRAHDCITLLLGDRKRYADYVAQNPGTYWYSPGWNRCSIMPGPERYQKYRQQYVEKFGEEDADFLMETEQAWFKSYNNAAFVDLGIGATAADVAYTKQCAQWLGWKYDQQKGDPKLLQDMLTGPWDDARFLVMQPGQSLKMTADERVVQLDIAPRRENSPSEISNLKSENGSHPNPLAVVLDVAPRRIEEKT